MSGEMRRVDWESVETAPRDGTVIIGIGQVVDENGLVSSMPLMRFIAWEGSDADFPGYEWRLDGTDAYAMWMKPILWTRSPDWPLGHAA